MKNLFRKQRHIQYVRRYISQLHWDSINVILVASATQWNDDVVSLLDNNAKLIRKYERRRRWLRF